MAFFGLSKSDVLVRFQLAKDYFHQSQNFESLPGETQDLAEILRSLELALQDMESLKLRSKKPQTCLHEQHNPGRAPASYTAWQTSPTCALYSLLNGLTPWMPLFDELSPGETSTSEHAIEGYREPSSF